MASEYRRLQHNPQDAPMLCPQVDTTGSCGVTPATNQGTSVEAVTRQGFYRLEYPRPAR